jgi:hypothetical protein
MPSSPFGFGAQISSGSSKIEISLLLRGNNSIKAFNLKDQHHIWTLMN